MQSYKKTIGTMGKFKNPFELSAKASPKKIITVGEKRDDKDKDRENKGNAIERKSPACDSGVIVDINPTMTTTTTIIGKKNTNGLIANMAALLKNDNKNKNKPDGETSASSGIKKQDDTQNHIDIDTDRNKSINGKGLKNIGESKSTDARSGSTLAKANNNNRHPDDSDGLGFGLESDEYKYKSRIPQICTPPISHLQWNRIHNKYELQPTSESTSSDKAKTGSASSDKMSLFKKLGSRSDSDTSSAESWRSHRTGVTSVSPLFDHDDSVF